ncbi:MAG: glycine zipper family protein [Woeseiaceae bacterium]
MKKNSLSLLASLPAFLIVAACAAHPDPIIDTKGVDANALAKDWDECEAYTEEIHISRGVAKGSATGAVVGAVGGAIDGEAGRGAGAGALYGATRSGLDADREKQKVFKRCLRGRGYRVLN